MALTPEEEDVEVTREEHGALRWAALVAAGAIIYLVTPIGVGILLGVLLAFVMQPIYGRLVPKLGAAWAAFTTVTAATLVAVGSAAGLASLFIVRGSVLARDLVEIVGPGGVGDDVVNFIGSQTARIGISQNEVTRRARNLAAEAAGAIPDAVESVLSGLATGLLAAFFAMLTMHYIIRNWGFVTLRAQEAFPLRPDYTRTLFAEFRRVGRTTLMGTIVTGIAQGLLATIGYWICGLREPIFFGAATAVASLVPAVGTMLVWVPAGVVLMLTGHPVAGIVELTWGGVMVVAVSDYVIRPRLVGGEGEVPSVVTFAALFGGVEVFGLKGLIVGPVLMSLAIAVLGLYAKETKLRRHITGSSLQKAAPMSLSNPPPPSSPMV